MLHTKVDKQTHQNTHGLSTERSQPISELTSTVVRVKSDQRVIGTPAAGRTRAFRN